MTTAALLALGALLILGAYWLGYHLGHRVGYDDGVAAAKRRLRRP